MAYYVELTGGDIQAVSVLNGGDAQIATELSGGDVYPSGGGSATLQTKSVSITPTESTQTQQITPDVGFDGLSEVDLTTDAIPANYVGSGVPRKTSADLTSLGAAVTAPAGYYENPASKAIPTGSATTPATTITANPTLSVSASGLITANVSATQNITPTVSPGYVNAGAAGPVNVSGTKTQQLATQAAATYHPATTDQTIPAAQYLTGAQTIKAVQTTNLAAENIKKDVNVQIGDADDPDSVANIIGTYEGGGGGYTNDDFADLSKPIGEVVTTRTSLPPYFFYQRTGVTKFTGNDVTSLTSANYAYCHTFYGCTALQEVVLPNVTSLQDKNSVFRGCTAIRKADLRGVRSLNGTSVFNGCSALEGIAFKGAYSAAGNAGTQLGASMFSGCTSLAYFDSAMVYAIPANEFSNCAALSVMVIRYSPNTNAGNIASLSNINAFTGTPFASGGAGGTLYVPSAKLAAYQAATNWATILGYANNQIKAIEGSYYETHWADGTPIS